jgi:hypothetical protein
MPSKHTYQMNQDAFSNVRRQKLMVSGYIYPESGCTLSVEVRRGMPIFSARGSEVGKVAAVVWSGLDHTATHILLSRLPEIQGYWLLPVSWIEQVSTEEIHLHIPEAEIQSLPQWHEA